MARHPLDEEAQHHAPDRRRRTSHLIGQACAKKGARTPRTRIPIEAHTMASIVQLVLWCALVVFSFVGAQRSSSRTARPTADAHALRAPITVHRKARPRHMERDHLVTWCHAQSEKRRRKYGLAANVSKRQIVGLGDYLDDSYFVPMGIGTPAQTLNVLPDTGSTNLWVIDSTCTDEKNCPSSSPKFTASMSKTHQGSRTPFHEVYGDHAAASGTISQDTVSLAGYSISPLAFGRVRHVTKRTMGPTVSGILGLSFHDPKLDDLEPFWQVLYERQEMQDYVFSFQLPKALVYAKPDQEEDALTSGGVFTLGVLDPQQYAGSISWSPLSRGYGMHAKKSWTIDVNEMRLNGHNVDLGPHRHALIDTGSSNIVGPRQAMDILHALIPGAQRFPPNPEYYMLPCNSSIQLDITFSDRTWTLPPDHLIMQKINQTMCLSALTTVEDTSDIPLGWIMGHPFLTHVFSVFDAKEERIGFASLPQGGVQNATLTQADIDRHNASRAFHTSNTQISERYATPISRMEHGPSSRMHPSSPPAEPTMTLNRFTDSQWRSATIHAPHHINLTQRTSHTSSASSSERSWSHTCTLLCALALVWMCR